MPEPATTDLQAVDQLREAHRNIKTEIGKVIVGQTDVVDQLLIALFCGGHALLVGVPGLAKTLLISTLARVLNLSFNRIQFTPDLMPSDITGTEILEEDQTTGHKQFRFVKGPIFANIILADEINRTPPKTQAALLQAMQEHEVTAGGETLRLEEPFFVLATQNPIEQEGTYPLPEAQLDRFMFNIWIDYPSEEEERAIVKSTTGSSEADITSILDGEQVLAMQSLVRKVPVADDVVDYAVRLVRKTRPSALADADTAQSADTASSDGISEWVSWGAGPRASQYLILGAKARAIVEGRYAASIEDVNAVAVPVLRHRIVTNFNAEAQGIAPTDLIDRIIG
jgi:MoxR-like ATPase